MSGKKRIELRSIGQPGACPELAEGAAVPTFFVMVAAVAVVCAIVIGGAQAQSAPPVATSTGPKKAEEQFKNIQALKGIPADQLIPAMQFVTASLGVECEFCHVEGAFEKDDKKPKQAARKMMEMMFA
ncbi:MAG: photosynthetic reaction center cytochrome c subunit family protein, partial [Candidatus Sulfotelmatobacter sp.]